jgi:hypothetical protein
MNRPLYMCTHGCVISVSLYIESLIYSWYTITYVGFMACCPRAMLQVADHTFMGHPALREVCVFILCNYRVSFVCQTVLTKMGICDAHN